MMQISHYTYTEFDLDLISAFIMPQDSIFMSFLFNRILHST